MSTQLTSLKLAVAATLTLGFVDLGVINWVLAPQLATLPSGAQAPEARAATTPAPSPRPHRTTEPRVERNGATRQAIAAAPGVDGLGQAGQVASVVLPNTPPTTARASAAAKPRSGTGASPTAPLPRREAPRGPKAAGPTAGGDQKAAAATPSPAKATPAPALASSAAQPTIPRAARPKKAEPLPAPPKDLLFRSGQYRIDPRSAVRLRKVAFLMRRRKALAIAIAGHSDARGNPAANQRLSEQRAKAAAGFLRRYGIDGGRISARGYGASRPAIEGNHHRAWARNRRVELRWR